MKFVNFDDYHSSSHFAATNEDPECHAKLLDAVRPSGPRFKAAASICSGGEVPFFTLASRCDVVIAVDHSYRSLATAYAKALLLKNLGALRTRDILCESHKEFYEEVEKLKGEFPGELYSHFRVDSYLFYDIQREWRVPSLDIIQGAVDNLHRIHFVHGDFSDLKGYAKFDLLYFSNAFEHAGRLKRPQPKDHIEPLVKEGSLMLLTALPYTDDFWTEHWKLVKEEKGLRSSWPHYLYQRVPPQVKEKVA